MKNMKLAVDSIRSVDVGGYKNMCEEALGKTIADRTACSYAIMSLFAMDDFTNGERGRLATKWIDKYAEAVSKEPGELAMIGTAKKAFATMNSFNCLGAGHTCHDCVFCVCENGVRCGDGNIHKCMCDILRVNLNKMEGKGDDE